MPVAPGRPWRSAPLDVCGMRLGAPHACVLPGLGPRPGTIARVHGPRCRPGTPMSTALDLGVAFAKVAFIMGFVLNLAGLLTWVERKQSAVMQDRVGANRASIFGFRAIG